MPGISRPLMTLDAEPVAAATAGMGVMVLVEEPEVVAVSEPKEETGLINTNTEPEAVAVDMAAPAEMATSHKPKWHTAEVVAATV